MTPIDTTEGIRYDFNGEPHFILREELDAIAITGRSDYREYQHERTEPITGATAKELFEAAKKRPGVSKPGAGPIHFMQRYSTCKSKYLHLDGYECSGRRPTDEVAYLSDHWFRDRVLRGDPKVCQKCKRRWQWMRDKGMVD